MIGCGDPKCGVCLGLRNASAYWHHTSSGATGPTHVMYVEQQPSPTSEALRDLALKIEDLCRVHPAYTQAWSVIQNASDHLQAMARCSEANRASRDMPDSYASNYFSTGKT